MRSSTDRREILIQHTEKDKAFQKVYEDVSERMKDLYYLGFQKSEIDRFEDYLRRIFNNLPEYEKAK